MSKGSPSMIALLGLLAVAGYQNRDKLSSLLQGVNGPRGDGTPSDGQKLGQTATGSEGGLIDNLRNMVSGAGGGGIAAGLSDLIGRFSNPVQAARAQTWVASGPNSALEPSDLEQVLDDETIAELVQKTGLSRNDILSRLSMVIPDAVDQLTPEGRMPSSGDAYGVS